MTGPVRQVETAPIPVHLVYVAGRKAPAKVRAFVDFAVERLRAEPVLQNLAGDERVSRSG